MAVDADTTHGAAAEKAQLELREENELTKSDTYNHDNIGAGAEAPMTWKTWLVIFILSSCFGLSFWYGRTLTNASHVTDGL